MKLILVCGLPGAGKSTVAKSIADKTKSYVFNTDIIRKELFDKPTYTDEEKEKIYSLLFEMAEKFLKSAKNVVLDGTFYREELRKKVKEIAEKTESDFHIVEVVCGEDKVKKRMERRNKIKCISDADLKVHEKIKKQFEPIREKHFKIKSGENEEKQIKKFLKAI